MSLTMNLTDALGYISHQEVAKAAFAVINGVQTEEPAVQVQAMAVVFLIMMDIFELNPRDELSRAEFIMKDAERQFDYRFKAVRQYIEEELRGRVY